MGCWWVSVSRVLLLKRSHESGATHLHPRVGLDSDQNTSDDDNAEYEAPEKLPECEEAGGEGDLCDPPPGEAGPLVGHDVLVGDEGAVLLRDLRRATYFLPR